MAFKARRQRDESWELSAEQDGVVKGGPSASGFPAGHASAALYPIGVALPKRATQSLWKPPTIQYSIVYIVYCPGLLHLNHDLLLTLPLYTPFHPFILRERSQDHRIPFVMIPRHYHPVSAVFMHGDATRPCDGTPSNQTRSERWGGAIGSHLTR